jgi:hypothetical protein
MSMDGKESSEPMYLYWKSISASIKASFLKHADV